MNWDAIGAVGEVVGAIAVVATLAYLAMQIRQNNKLLSSESRQTLVGHDIASLSANLDHTEVFAKYVSGQALTPEDQLSLSFMFALDLRNREFEYFQYKNGLLDEESWLSYRQVVEINHSCELGRKWWRDVGRRLVAPEFAAQVDALLKTADSDDTYLKMSKWANP